MTSEELLIKRAKSGDEQAFADIVRLYEKAVYNSALYIAKSRDDALDISQEVFLKLWRTLPSYRGDASLKTWIATITKTCAIDYVRSRNQKSVASLTVGADEKETDVVDEDISSDPEKSLEQKERIAAVRKAVASLDEPIRQTLILREFHNLSYAEIATVMKISEGTVKSRISRGREQVKEFLKSGNFL